jgi:squalene synthase HpnC
MSKYSFAAELEKYGPRPTHTAPITPRQARRYCRRLAKGHYENFTVVSRLFPSRLRQDFCHLYAYCRWADDLADETGDAKLGLALLNWWETQLRACFQGQTVHPVFIALSETIKRYKMPIDPFVDLLAAFRQDQRVQRYETFDQVTDYCRYSANPVGRLILHLGECATPERLRLADSVCTGLQLANFCQDVALDWRRGRVYLAQGDCRRFGFDERAFAAGKSNQAFERLMTVYCDHAEGFLRGGWPLVGLVPYDLQLSVAVFIHGGLAILQNIRRQNFDVWTTRPSVSRIEKLRIVAKCWWRLQRGTLAGSEP